MKFKDYQEFREEREKHEVKLKKRKRIIDLIFDLFFLGFVFIVLPSLIVMALNLFNLVIFGDMSLGAFIDSILDYSWKPVSKFYLQIGGNCRSFIYRVTH